MKFYMPTNRLKLWLILFLVMLGLGSFVYNQYLIESILKQERASVELWAKAMEYTGRSLHTDTREELMDMVDTIQKNPAISQQQKQQMVQTLRETEADLANASLDFVASELIVKNRFEIPSIVVDEKGNILFSRNVEEQKLDDELLQKYRSMNPPITITLGEDKYNQKQYVYYGESATVQLLRFFPYIQFGLLAVLLGIGYTSYKSISQSEQSSLWVGMAKEAAHQLGTPISSLYGWIELLKEERGDDEQTVRIVHELENDVKRLQGVAERFNKIGSEPELKYKRIAPILNQVLDYMEHRLPQLGKNVDVRRSIDTDVKLKVNIELFQWALENLIKNAMDAINSSAEHPYVSITTSMKDGRLVIDVEDSGKGIEKKYFKEIFKPGYSTKKRGWGLGLSLTKRIIEEYHKGEIYVERSEKGAGTVIRITLPVQKA